MIAECAHNRRKYKLHARIGEHQQSAPATVAQAAGDAAAGQGRGQADDAAGWQFIIAFGQGLQCQVAAKAVADQMDLLSQAAPEGMQAGAFVRRIAEDARIAVEAGLEAEVRGLWKKDSTR